MINDVLDPFRQKLLDLSRDDLLEIIRDQNPDLIKHINRIEWVFSRKLKHLTWNDGTPIDGRPVTNEELTLLIDEPFNPNPELARLGLTIEQQRELHICKDPVLWSRHLLNMEPRAYQILMLRYPKNRKVLRAGRRLGKTVTMSIKMLHYSYINQDGRTLVLTPMKSQSDVIYKEMERIVKTSSSVVKESITRRVTSPYYVIEFTTGSTIKFFSTGMSSGGKADVARGQEAHLIVLDELDYMGPDDLDAIYAMLQKTDDNQPDKELIGASTPTGRREKFWEWAVDPKKTGRFKEFWFPSYVNPHFNKEVEQEFRDEYTEMVYRHEIEADWGEDVEGVYPRKYIDLAFNGADDWQYECEPTPDGSFYVIGVDWDKYGAGTNIVVLEVCGDDYHDKDFAGRIRIAWREETKREDYSLLNSVKRLIDLNYIFQPRHIYVDRGFGEVQVEMLHKHGQEHPETGLSKRVKGVSFSENLVMRDPASKQEVKKEIKPFMVDNLRQMLEKQQILFPASDDLLYRQLIGYVVLRTTPTGKPIFEGGEAGDHAHDGLILACLAITQNYGDLMKLRLATKAVAVSNEALLPMLSLSEDENTREKEEEAIQDAYGSKAGAPVFQRRAFTVKLNSKSPGRPITRKSF